MITIRANKNKVSSGRNKKTNKIDKKNKEQFSQDLMPINDINNNIITINNETGEIELKKYYIRIVPKNISIMMEDVIKGVIHSLTQILNSVAKIEILVVDKTERVDDNKEYLKTLIERTKDPLLQNILRQDLAELYRNFSQSSSREFYLIVPYKNDRELEKIQQFERGIKNLDHETMDTSKNDIKNMLQVYLERNFSNVIIGDYDR